MLLRSLFTALCTNTRGAIALNAGLVLLPVMIIASFVFDRGHL